MRNFDPRAHGVRRARGIVRRAVNASRIGWAARLGHVVCVGLVLCLGVGLGVSRAASPDRVPSAGCGRWAAPLQGATVRTTIAGLRPRTYLIQVPADYDSSRPYPLVFVFHGAGGSARDSQAWGLQNAPGAGSNGIFIFPNAIHFQDQGVGWDDTEGGHDLPFFDNLVRDVGAAFCVDESRIFVAGFSWGGDFAVALACHRGDVVRAVAANSTDDEFKDTANYLTYEGLPCPSHKRPAVRFAHAVGGDAQYPAPDFATTSRLFRYLNACAADSTPVASSTPRMTCAAFNACASDYTECAFDAAIGHALPPNWARDTWEFFSHF